MSVTRLRLIHTPTPAWEEVRSFYRDVLRIPEAGGWDEPGSRGVFLDAGSGELELMEQSASELGIVPGVARGWLLALEVADAPAELERLRALGVCLLQELQQRPWGGCDFLVRDPAGNPVLLYQPGVPGPKEQA